jgi:micrococcal nuclease
MFAPLLALVACYSLDDVPIQVGGHCKPPEIHTVVRVLDGDTVQLDSCSGPEVRLLGVSAPEVVHDVADACVTDPSDDSTARDDCYGPEARAYLDELLTGRTVRIEYDETCTDRYQRELGYVYLLAEGAVDTGDEEADTAARETDLFVNLELIRRGYARVYEEFDDIRQAEVLYTAQYAAQASSAGLWGVCE